MKAIMLYIETVSKQQSPQARLVALQTLRHYIETLESDARTQMTREELLELTGSNPIEDFKRLRDFAARQYLYWNHHS